jgi:hypothetical protein
MIVSPPSFLKSHFYTLTFHFSYADGRRRTRSKEFPQAKLELLGIPLVEIPPMVGSKA